MTEAVACGPIGEIEVAITRVQVLDELVGCGSRQFGSDPVVGLEPAAFEGHQQRVGVTGLQVAEREGFPLAG
jgi:hypothetical protein